MSTAVRPLTYLTRTTVILLVGLCLVAAWRAWADWFVVRAAENYYGIDPLTRAMSLRDTAGWAYTATLAVAAAVFFCWIWRARANAEHLSRAEHRLHRGWVIGGWLAPMLNAFMPKVLLEDIWRTSRPDVRPELLDARDLPSSKLVATWWLTWAATVFFAVWERAVVIQPVTDLALRRTADANLVFSVAHCLSGALLVIVVVRISRWQSTPRG